MNFKDKYLKYKYKYNNFKKIIGGSISKTDIKLGSDTCIKCKTYKTIEAPSNMQDILKKDYANRRIINTRTDTLNITDYNQTDFFFIKPKGIWYGFGDSWIEWASSEMPEKVGKYFFDIEIDTSKILKVSTKEEAILFVEKYGVGILKDIFQMKLDNMENIQKITAMGNINWFNVAKDYSGFELNPYIYELRPDSNFLWINAWDMASGVIWDSSIIKKINSIP